MFSNLNNLVTKYSFRFNTNDSFLDIFFDKFKNLLDDYIVNYFIKYFFYFLFISFFILELSHGVFSLMNSNHGAILILSEDTVKVGYGVVGSFVLDLFSFVFSINIISLLYDFFSFNLDFIILIISYITNYNIYILNFLVLIFFYFSFIFVNKMRNNNVSFYTILLLFVVYSFIFYTLFISGIISMSFYVFFTLLVLVVSPFVICSNLNNLDYVLFFIIISLFFLPNLILFFVLLYMSYLYIVQNKRDLKPVDMAYDLTVDELFNALFLVMFLLVISAGGVALAGISFNLIVFTYLIVYVTFISFLFNRG